MRFFVLDLSASIKTPQCALRLCGVFLSVILISGRVDGAEYAQATGASDARTIAWNAFKATMGEPGESHGFDPVRVHAIHRRTADFGIRQQLSQAFHERQVVRAAAADQQLLGIRLGMLQ